MSRPKGSKNKVKKNPGVKKNLFEWNETIQKLINEENDHKEIQKETENQQVVNENKNDKQDSEQLSPHEENKKKKVKDELICDRCGKVASDSLNTINLTYLTGRASWHREVKNDKPKLCHECCKNLNELIDNFLISGGCKTKWERD